MHLAADYILLSRQLLLPTFRFWSIVLLAVSHLSAQTQLPEAKVQPALPYATLSEALLQNDWIDPLFFDTEGRQPGLYLKLDRQYELQGYARPDTSQLYVYAYWPEELYYNNIRYWVEITEVRQADQELIIAFQSRTLPSENRACYVGQLHFQRSYSGWKLIAKKLFPLD